MENKTFHWRNLPHLHYEEGIYFITYRLANSIPVSVLEELHSSAPGTNDDKTRRIFNKYDSLLDSGEYGKKYLSDSRVAEIVKKTMEYPDGKDYMLICYCIMPNHVHMVFELKENCKGISKIMQSVKRISARQSNIVLNRKGKFWQDESFDRLVRNEGELQLIIMYVLMNPVKARLVNDWKNWKYSYCKKGFYPS